MPRRELRQVQRVSAESIAAGNAEGASDGAAPAVEWVYVGVDADAQAAAPRERAAYPAESAVVLVGANVDALVPAAQPPPERVLPVEADPRPVAAPHPPRHRRRRPP